MIGKIAPSVASLGFDSLRSRLLALEGVGIKRLHIDVSDGRFVPEILIGFPVISSIRPDTVMDFDVHLLCEDPKRYIMDAARAGADCITVQKEVCSDLPEVLAMIKALGRKAGVALNPTTPVETIFDVAGELDQIVIVGSSSGRENGELIPGMIKKLTGCRKLMDRLKFYPVIVLDGGVTMENAAMCMESGADYIVTGEFLFRGDFEENVIGLCRKLQQ